MNITVLVARGLQPACEGRSKIELGVPPSSDIADILQTLLALYPGLRAFVPNEQKPHKPCFSVAAAGKKIYLFSASTTRLTGKAVV